MKIAQVIENKLREALDPIHLDIIDDSARHAGHAGHTGAGESHYKIYIVSQDFENINRIERHRKIYTILSDELKSRVHALQLTTYTQSEHNLR